MNVKLRELKESDASLMLEWMHDISIVEKLDTDFMSKSIEDCIQFIRSSLNDDDNLHLAITADDDIYQGTVSLKNIRDNMAEFAIAIRTSAMGRGIAKKAMEQILNLGFSERNLKLIYWYVSPENKRALRFYKKNMYKQVFDNVLDIYGFNYDKNDHYEWFCIRKDEWIK